MVILKSFPTFVGAFFFLRFMEFTPYNMFTLVFTTMMLEGLFLRKPEYPCKMLGEEEESEVLRQFEPEPLVPETKIKLPKKKIVGSCAGKRIIVDGKDCLNLGTCNYFNFSEDAEIIKYASESINRYGVNSCGPRLFYGTFDIHLELEKKLAEFFEVEEAILYSYWFCTAASAIPSYCRQSDIIFVDDAVNFAIQKGLDAARAQVVYFKHNNTKDLERLLIKYPAGEKQKRFLVVEGIYLATGNLCPLPELVRLRAQYKLRMIMDESVSFGTLGSTGRGVFEHFEISLKEVDVRIGSLEGAFESSGGFICGSHFIVEQQKLSGAGFIYTTSQSPLLAVTAMRTLEKLKNAPHFAQDLQKNSEALHEALRDLPGLSLVGDAVSPIKHLQITNSESYENDMMQLEAVCEACLDRGLAVVVPTCLSSDISVKAARIRVVANVNLDQDDFLFIRESLRDVCTEVVVGGENKKMFTI